MKGMKGKPSACAPTGEMREIFGCMVDIVKSIRGKKKIKIFQGEFQELTGAQIHVMHYLFEKDNATMTELADYARVKMPTMTDNVNTLVKYGYVNRTHEENDRRKVTVHMAAKGKKIVMRHIEANMKHLEALFKDMTQHEKTNILKLLKLIKTSLERIQK